MPPLHHQLVTLEAARPARPRSARRRRAGARARDRVARGDATRPTPAGLGDHRRLGAPVLPPLRREAGGALPAGRPARVEGRRVARCACCRTRSASRATRRRRSSSERRRVLLLRSDHLATIADGANALVDRLDFWRPTSIRQGLRGRRLRRRARACRSGWRLAAGVAGAELIPASSELFLGFTSTQKANLGPARIANLETLGYSDGGLNGYFRQGTCMHVSHIFEDLEASGTSLFSHSRTGGDGVPADGHRVRPGR